MRKVNGPYKVVQSQEGWKIVRVIGSYESDNIQKRRAEVEARPPRPARHGQVVSQYSETYWETVLARAGQDIVRDVDGGKIYPHRQAAYRRCLQFNRQHEKNLKEAFLAENGTIPQEDIQSLNILQGTFGCHSTDHADIDPYYDQKNWQEAARNDGCRYSGVLEVVERQEGEAWQDFYTRAKKRAWQLDQELDCSCSY